MIKTVLIAGITFAYEGSSDTITISTTLGGYATPF